MNTKSSANKFEINQIMAISIRVQRSEVRQHLGFPALPMQSGFHFSKNNFRRVTTFLSSLHATENKIKTFLKKAFVYPRYSG